MESRSGRKDILTDKEKALALRNALRYFRRNNTQSWRQGSLTNCAPTDGFTYRLRPKHEMKAYPIEWYPEVQASGVCDADDPEQFGPRRGATPRRIDRTEATAPSSKTGPSTVLR